MAAYLSAKPLTPTLSPQAGRGRDPCRIGDAPPDRRTHACAERGGRVRGRSGSPPDAIALGPAEAGSCLSLRSVFAADPARIAEFVEKIEEERIVDLPDIGLVTAGIAGDLHMRIVAGERPDAMGEIALHDLHMVEIELQLEVGSPDSVDDRHRLGRGIEEVSRYVAVVNGLDDQGEAFAREPVGRVPQICDIDAFGLGAIMPLRPQPGHCMQDPAPLRLGVNECGLDPVAKLLLAP